MMIDLAAAKRLGVDPSECIVFEDAKAGIDAAVNAMMKVIAIGGHIKTTDCSNYDAWIADLTSIQVEASDIVSNAGFIEYTLRC